jgi:hypothetical protein
MTIEARSARDGPGAVLSARAGGPAPRPRAANRQAGVVWLGVGLATLAHVLRSRRFRVQVIVGVIGLGALVRIARENQAATLARLAAWDKARSATQRRAARSPASR